MIPQEKAKELVNKYLQVYDGRLPIAKQCALIAVDLRLDGDFLFSSIEYGEDSLEYWQEVKQEINNL